MIGSIGLSKILTQNKSKQANKQVIKQAEQTLHVSRVKDFAIGVTVLAPNDKGLAVWSKTFDEILPIDGF